MTKEKILTRFVGVCKISGHPTAENLFKASDELLMKYEVPKEFIVCSSVDGASAMFSGQQSVVNRQK